jgi:Fe-S oxidoreductase
MFGPELVQAFNEFKSLWDPDWKMNPGKVVMPYHPTENLRLGADFHQWSPETHFQFPGDNGRIDRAVGRCVGVGKCRRMDGGTMCPSFMVTREEEHSTRGRARLLFEMFEGKTIPANWNNEAVKDSLDLCLACKGCKGDCPVNVDMATYKAEFLSHYYERKLRPMAAYSMGWIYWWARIAEIAPAVANAFMAFPLTRILGGVAPERRMPRFAKSTFVADFKRRSDSQSGRTASRTGESDLRTKRVLLWPDTFNNHFHPGTAHAAADVLAAAGYDVIIPDKRLCCGRPLYDWGFLGMAKTLLRETIDALKPQLDEGIPIVGLEPSCVSVFRDELPNLFPNDADAIRLSKAVKTLPEFLLQEGVALPKLDGKALVQGHCHHKAVLHFDDEEQVLKKLGLDVDHPDSGCCGMAGAFGFEKDKYELSMRVGERVLLPAVREASRDTIIIADGFSCREQIAQGTGREALHLAEVLHLAMKQTGTGELPEHQYAQEPAALDVPRLARKAAGIAGGVALLAAGVALLRRWRKR